MTDFPTAPEAQSRLDPHPENPDVLAFLARRRSTPRLLLQGPAPDRNQLANILRIAARVPDHRALSPWRFVVFARENLARAGKILAARFGELHPTATQADLDMQYAKTADSPMIIMLVFSPVDDFRTPAWEQHLSAGAVGMNLLATCNAAGFGANWITGWSCDDETIKQAFGVGENERIVGYFHVGKARENVPERKRPDMAEKVVYWEG